jgi:hypothetical protein
VEFIHPERLARALMDFQEGRSRLIVAFRHPYGDEPQLLMHAVSNVLPRAAASIQARFPRRPRLLFLHGYEVPLWSDALTRWILPRTGAMPVYHARLDSAGLMRIRAALLDGPHPLALAPEGQSSYLSESTPRIEGGTMRLARWCAQDLAQAGRHETVEVLPLSVHCLFQGGPAALEGLLGRLEGELGFEMGSRGRADPAARILDIFSRLLSIAEGYYRNGLEPRRAPPSAQAGGRSAVECLEARRAELVETALRRGEAAFGLHARGDPIDRVYRIRQEGWDRVFPPEGLPPWASYARALADRRAAEAWQAMRHMELVDLLWYLDAHYLEARPSFTRLAESAYNMWDLANRLLGGNISGRPHCLRRLAVIAAGNPIRVGPGADPGADQTLRRAFMDCIDDFRKEETDGKKRAGRRA